MVIFLNVLPQIFGAFALITWLISVQLKKKSDIFFLQLLANLFYAIQYFLLGLTSTGILNLVSASRCYIFGYNAKRNKQTPLYILLVFLFAVLVLALIFSKSYLDLMPMIATLLYTIFTWKSSTSSLRYVYVFCGILFGFYNIAVGAYVALLGNLGEIISGTVSIIRFRKEGNK